MPTNATRPIVIVGAGVAGLTIGHQLASRRAVAIVERNEALGGLGRSWHYGDFHFDVGPHRFHTENARVAAFIRDILKEEAIEIPRRSGVRMFGRFHAWPLRPTVLLSIPLATMLRVSKDLVLREHREGESFEADVVSNYGRTLHDIFFGPYTEKFLFHSPRELHRDWARAGVNRAIIDKRARADSLWSLLKTTFLPAPVDTTFLYPPTGVGRFSERLADGIRAMNGEIVLGQTVTGVETAGDRVTAVRAGERRIPCESLVWTGPLTVINRHLGVEGIDLDYLSTVFFNMEIGKPLKRDYQWIYYGGDEIFSRVSAPATFSAATVPRGKSSLCVEMTCREGDGRWYDPERYAQTVIRDLVRTQTIDHPSDVQRVHIERVPDTYPIYKLNYLAELTGNLRALSRFGNLLLAGRCGRFWYNNMDHSIGQGLTMSERILRGDMLSSIDDSADREFWAAEHDGLTPAREEEIAEPM